MKIDGRLIASEIKSDLKKKIDKLKQKNISPRLAVVLIGNDPSSEAYVRQKQKFGEEIGVEVSIYRFATSESYKDTSEGEKTLRHLGGVRSTPPRWSKQKKELLKLVDKLNKDPSVHGIIIQRPVPLDISKEELDNLVIPQKDVDGFHPHSPFTPPIAFAVIKILESVFQNSPGRSPSGHLPGVSSKDTSTREHPRGGVAPAAHPWGEGIAELEEFKKDFMNWLKKQKILIIGRGETAGKPIAETLQKMGIKITIAHSKTNNLPKLCLASDIIITCVGRPNVVRRNMVLSKTILIGVGLHQENGKLLTDYDQKDIYDKVAYITPVPGGVGPVNVACLFENLISTAVAS